MDDLVAFLRARLDEDEAAARAAMEWSAAEWAQDPDGHGYVIFYPGGPEPFLYSVEWPQRADHIARHDPARVLRDVEAKRSIIDDYEIMAGVVDGVDTSGVAITRGERDALLDALRRLAAVYSDHPDYRPEWRPA